MTKRWIFIYWCAIFRVALVTRPFYIFIGSSLSWFYSCVESEYMELSVGEIHEFIPPIKKIFINLRRFIVMVTFWYEQTCYAIRFDVVLFPLEQERVRYFRLTGTECPDRAAGYSYLRNVVTEIVEEGRDRDAGGSVRAVGEVVRRVRGEGETSGVRAIADSHGYGGCLH